MKALLKVGVDVGGGDNNEVVLTRSKVLKCEPDL